MEMITKYKKIIIGAVVLIILFVVYNSFFKEDSVDNKNGGSSNGLLSSNVGQKKSAVVGNEIISALNQIESLTLDRSIFSDPVYKSLKDRSQVIPPEPVGKANPFDPIGGSLIIKKPGEFDNFGTTTKPVTGPRGPQTIINSSLINQAAI